MAPCCFKTAITYPGLLVLEVDRVFQASWPNEGLDRLEKVSGHEGPQGATRGHGQFRRAPGCLEEAVACLGDPSMPIGTHRSQELKVASRGQPGP